MSKIRPNSLAIVIHKDRVLAMTGYDPVKDQHFYRLLGGGVEFGETAEEAVVREFKEELNTDLHVTKRLDVIDSIYTYQGKPGHEITFVFLGTITDPKILNSDTMPILDNDNNMAAWVPIEDVLSKKSILYPEGTPEMLRDALPPSSPLS
jgi:ADP-ribose pyrophosphatase YjhB (NUDIX family)